MPACACYAGWLAFCAAFQARVAAALGRAGYLSAKRPCTTIGLCALVALLCTPGFLRFETKTSSSELWVEQDSDAMLGQRYVDDNWGADPLSFRFLIQARDMGQNALTAGAFRDAFDIVDEVWAVETADGLKWTDLCARSAAGDCVGLGPLRFFSWNRTAFEERLSADGGLLAALSVDAYPDNGQPVYRGEVFGELRASETQQIESAGIWRLDLLLRPNAKASSDDVSAWQKEVIDRFVGSSYAGVEQRWEHIHVELWASGRSTDDELGRSVSGDITFMIYAYNFLVMACALLLGPPLRCVRGRRLLGACDFLLVLGASAAGYGLSSALGVPFTSLQQILPFILVGVGVDDAYVIVGAFDHTDRSRPVEERMKEALEKVGTSVTLTSATSVLSFLCGSAAAFPAVSYFCVYAGLSLVFIYAFHVTAFCAMLAVDERRQEAGRLDCVFCISSGPADAGAGAGAGSKEAESLGERAIATYTRAITCHVLVKLAIVGAFLLSAGLFLWQAIEKTDTSFSVMDLAPDNSYMRKFLETEIMYWGGDSTNLDQKVGLYFSGAEVSDAATQAQMARTEDALLAIPCISKEKGVVSWRRRFSEWVSENRDEPALSSLWTAGDFKEVGGQAFLSGPAFYAALDHWLSDCSLGCNFKDDVTIRDGRIRASRVGAVQTNIPKADDQVDCLIEIEAFNEHASGVLPDTFASARMHIFYHTYRVIRRELFTTIFFCFISVLVVSTVVISHPTTVAIILGVLVLIFVHLLGALPISGVSLNSVSMVNLVMAIGLVVDYSMHIAHSFMIQAPSLSKDERVLRAMKEIGLSVALGIFSTFVAVLPLALATSEVFRIFFKMFLAILLAGGTHGLILMPVVLSLIGPAAIHPVVLDDIEDVEAEVTATRSLTV